MLEWSDVDWGNAPSWGALVAASTAAVFAGRNVHVDVRDRRQRQAAQVAAWFGDKMIADVPGYPARSPGAWVRNASSLPVYQLHVEWLLDGVLWRHATVATVPPGEEPMFVRLPPLSEYSRDAAEGDSSPQAALAARVEVPNSELDVRITFTDTAGRTWRRSVDGVLTEGR